MKSAPAVHSRTISTADLAWLQAHLRHVLGCRSLWLDEPRAQGASVQLRIGTEVLGTVDQVDDEGERSWAVTMIVLEDDLTR